MYVLYPVKQSHKSKQNCPNGKKIVVNSIFTASIAVILVLNHKWSLVFLNSLGE